MGAIYVGADAVNGNTNFGVNNNAILTGYPANGTGTITSVDIWMWSNGTSVKVAMFYGSGASWRSRTTGTLLGSIASRSKQTITGLSIPIQLGDIIGITGDGSLERTSTSGSGFGYDCVMDTNVHTATMIAGNSLSLCGIGETASAGGGGILVGSVLNSDLLRSRILRS